MTAYDLLLENSGEIIFNRTGSHKRTGLQWIDCSTKRFLESNIETRNGKEVYVFFNPGFLGSVHKWTHYFNLKDC